jgi:hypothetical protein
MTPDPDGRRPTFAAFTYTFVPFAAGVTLGNLYAETRPDPTLAKGVYSVWLSIALAAPALLLFGLYDLRHAPAGVYNYWRLFWGFAFLAYLIHFYYAFVVFFDADVHQVADRQTWPVAISNFVVTALWAASAALAWAGGRPGGTAYAFQWVAHVVVLGAVVVAGIVFKTGFVSVLSWVAVAALAGGWLSRLMFGDPTRFRAAAPA